jgi:hypothetical protein
VRERERERLGAVPLPRSLPPYTAIFTDTEGTVWVVVSSPGDAETRLRAIGARGRVVGEVRIPRDLRVMEVGSDYVLGVYDDASSTQHLAVYRLRRRAETG